MRERKKKRSDTRGKQEKGSRSTQVNLQAYNPYVIQSLETDSKENLTRGSRGGGAPKKSGRVGGEPTYKYFSKVDFGKPWRFSLYV
ncbi:hypothetical protein COE58_22790 [Bacillus cereus]|nr:hypothetical protein COE58_22790 [Bacillus cereus]